VKRILELVDQHQEVFMARLVLPSFISHLLTEKKLRGIREEYQRIVIGAKWMGFFFVSVSSPYFMKTIY
jgi:hypothetical protein